MTDGPSMRDLIEALEIFLRYEEDAGTCAQHDVFMVCVDPDVVSLEDKAELHRLGFIEPTKGGDYDGCFISFRFGSC